MSTVKTGLDRMVEQGFAPLRGRRLGLVMHPASRDRHLRRGWRLCHQSPLTDVRALFGPQHGFLGQTQDNMIEWQGFTDRATGLPVHSLYGEVRKPTPEMLADVDTLVIDLQDVGARYYTFIWTLYLCMEACAELGKSVVVLDRPNPIGGVELEGPVLDPAYSSFVGLAPVPVRHGLTSGELALFFRHWRGWKLDLEVVWMDGWRRAMDFEATGLPWVLPSPNMPTVDTAFVYPGGCLLEATNLSEGRGTTRPFEIFGAPWVDADTLVGLLRDWKLPGLKWRPLDFEPTFHKHANQVCGGVQVHVTDRKAFRPLLTYTAAIAAIRELWPERFAWKEPPYEYETVKLPIDILAGGPEWRTMIEEGRRPWSMAEVWRDACDAFDADCGEFRHYD
ncbi:MAG TPA: DUF1343 domain-containing protein [Candidatus Krumholzibacteria bacterium]|nr:DUF1343 domain-containing protein [Candidatus Krumholzibacteria bacterium]